VPCSQTFARVVIHSCYCCLPTRFIMITLLSPHYVLQEVTEDDIVVASLAWGFTIGFGWLTTWTAMKQTKHIYKRHRLSVFRNAYVWMIWLEILVCLIFSIICWLHLKDYIPPRLGSIPVYRFRSANPPMSLVLHSILLFVRLPSWSPLRNRC
jgi:amino acid transporter